MSIEAADLTRKFSDCKTVEAVQDALINWVLGMKEQGYTLDACDSTLNMGQVEGRINLVDPESQAMGYCMGIAARRGSENLFYYIPAIDDCKPVAGKYGIEVF